MRPSDTYNGVKPVSTIFFRAFRVFCSNFSLLSGGDDLLPSGQTVIQRLLASSHPSIVLRTRLLVLGEPEDSPAIKRLREEVRRSALAQGLLSWQSADGTIQTSPERRQTHPYQKWQGPHWTLYSLAEIGYPPGDSSLVPMRDQFYDWLLKPSHLCPPHTLVIPGQEDRVRRCAGQEGCAVWYSLRLGLGDARTEELVRRLRSWQWPDGGWNCDRRPAARKSSFMETLLPLRALALHGRITGDPASRASAARAAEVFLSRRLYRRRTDGGIIRPAFTRTHFPHYYHYDILAGLVVLAEAGLIRDERCGEALDLLESKRLPDGGFPLEEKTWKTTDRFETRGTFADWGPAGRARMNEFVTLEALYVLRKAGRIWAVTATICPEVSRVLEEGGEINRSPNAVHYFLRTGRLGFRTWCEADFDLAIGLWGDGEVTKLIGGPFSRAQVEERLRREIANLHAQGVQYWPVFFLSTGEHLGCCGLRPYQPDERIFEIGFHIRHTHWGRGYASEAARAVMGYAFGEFGAAGLFAGHNPANEASRHLLQKLGFCYTHDEYYPPTGLHHPSYMLSREEFGRNIL